MEDALARLKAANADMERRDRALTAELAERRESARVTSEGIRPGAAESVPPDLTQETIVRRTGRPVLSISRDQARLVFEDPDSRVWKERLERASVPLARATSAVGRIEVEGHKLAWLGTGWLVDSDVVVTNRHVALEFARGRGTEFVFRQGLLGAPMAASIDFIEEFDRQDSLVFRLERVMHIEDDDGPDLAFLRVMPGAGLTLSDPIALAADLPQPDEQVAVIGYPARDSRIPDTALMEQIFGMKYDKKRLAPGLITTGTRTRVQHDCTTLGGNSGSVVVSLRTGEAVGLHFAGRFLVANFAVPSITVRERLDEVRRGSMPRRAPDADVVQAFRAATGASSVTSGDVAQALRPADAALSPGQMSFVVPVRVTFDVGQASANASPPPAAPADRTGAGGDDLSAFAEAIHWEPEEFSRALTEAMSVHDYNCAETLLQVFSRHARQRSYPYPALYACRDLATLRRKRQFTLMRRYVEAVLATGTTDLQVRRQYGQSLIELGQLDRARQVLDAVVRDGAQNASEAIEARGLLGRSYKQQYADAPAAAGAAERLQQAIAAYEDVYKEDPGRLWHGINAVSCRLRAARDGMEWADPERARRTAYSIRDRIEKPPAGTPPLEVWDYATRVEALLAIDDYDSAEAALDQYLKHPALDAFEVSSTYRQFVQILQLDHNPRGKRILDKLWESVERLRAGGAIPRVEANERPAARIPILVRVTNPAWTPEGIPDLAIHGRLGTIIAAEASRAAITELLRNPAVISIEESRAAGTAECTVSVPFINVSERYDGPAGPYSETGDRALIAIIDDGIDVLHTSFLDHAGRSRIVGIWDQKDPSGPAPQGFGFGTYHSREDVARYVSERATPANLRRNVSGHGTHVASIASGRRVGTFGGGVAPGAQLLVVISDSRDPIGYSQTHIAALDFIDRTATALGLPVVVNVSQGMNAGAHDGRSALEVGFDEFSGGGRKPGRVVVKSAGNERSKKGHAVVVLGQNVTEILPWRRQQGATWPNERIELWWSSANQVEFRLSAPSGDWSEPAGESRPSVKGALKGTPFRMDFIKRHVDNGDSQLRIDIGDGSAEIPSGVWKLEIKSGSVPEDGTVHAWIERGDEMPSAFEERADGNMTLSIPGTAQSVITVGAVRAKEGNELGTFSSFGPTRDGRNKPEVAAPGLGIKAARGGTADDIVEMDGTSMAAPHVAGAIALILSKTAKAGGPVPTASQLASALRQKTKNYNARWEPGRGYGVVDVAKLLAAF